jgi:hypothetical protein
MKKLLLLLFISLGLIGSANANSIKGAFGYELGQVLSDVTVNDLGDYGYSAIKTFKPNKPFFNFNKYFLSTTLKKKKVHLINASFKEQSTLDDKCGRRDGDYSKVLRVLEEKYGEFNELKNYIFQSRGDSRHSWRKHAIIKNPLRTITLRCDWYYDFKQPTTFNFTMNLTYEDIELTMERNNDESHLLHEKLEDNLEGVEY